MKKWSTLVTLLMIVCLSQLSAQEGRFLTNVFDQVKVTRNVVYGVNATVILLPQVGQAVPQPLTMDVYEPVGDERVERPLVLIFHTGNFLPVPQNLQINGTKTDSSIVEYATRLAKMGYTAASCTYRQGWNPVAQSQPERALGLIQAAYRGIQDARTAIRFFKRNYVEGGNTFGVDTSRVVLWGEGTGGYITLGAAALSNYLEIVNTTNGAGKFVLDTNGDGIPDTPMVVEAVHGDIEGKKFSFGIPAFGFPLGDTLTYPNHVDYSSKFHLQLNIGGAMGDISWLQAGEVPMISFQSPNDFFAPYEDRVLIVPTTRDPIVQVQGALTVHSLANVYGNNKVFLDANIDDEFTTQAIRASRQAGHDYIEGLYPVITPLNQFGQDEGVPVQWWSKGIWDAVAHPLGGTFHTQGLFTNAMMSAEQGRRYIDTVMGYFAPRAFAALDLLEYTNTEEINENDAAFAITPNPATDQIILRSSPAKPMQAIELYDINGRLVKSFSGVDNNYFYMQREQLPNGVYVAKVRFKEGILAKKVIFN